MSTFDTKSFNTFNDCRTCMKLDKDLRSTLSGLVFKGECRLGELVIDHTNHPMMLGENSSGFFENWTK